MKYHFIIILLSCLFIISINEEAKSQLGLPMVKNYDPDEYKGGIQNWQIAQDNRGMIYVANNLGLLQYDGNDWKTHNVAGASKLRSLAIAPEGRIYVGGQGDFGYFEPDSIGSLIYHSLKSAIPKKYANVGETWKVYIVNNKIYFCTFSYIYVYDKHTIEVIENPETLDVSFSAGNNIYTHIPQHGLYMLKNNSFSPNHFSSYFADKTVSGVISLNSQELLITTSRHGVFKTDQSSIAPWDLKLNKLFSETFINCTIMLTNGNIALGTQHNGIYIIDQKGDIVLHMTKERGLLSRTIHSLYEDKNSNLWIGQNNGISFIELKSPFRIINEEAGLPGTGYTALQKNNKLYLGTNNGVFISNDNGIEIMQGSEGQVYTIQSINQDLLIGHNNGSYIVKNGKAEPLNLVIGAWTFLKVNNTLFQGTYEGIKILDPHDYSIQGIIPNLKESSRIIVLENDSTIWMSHDYRGIYRIQINEQNLFTNPEIEYYNSNNGLPTDLFNTVQLIEGKLKISTQDGIYSYDSQDNSFVIDTLLSSYLGDNFISSMKSDPYGNIYFITPNSIGFLEKINSTEYKKHTDPFNSIRKLLNDDLPNINFTTPNKVLFGSKEGFISFDRNLFWTTTKENFTTIIRHIEYGGEESFLLYGGNKKLTNDKNKFDSESIPEIDFINNSISFHFSSTSFSSTENPEFQYKLVGFEKNWNDWTEYNFKEYTNLKDGKYTFQVRSRNSNHLESEMETYKFRILYPWYRSPFAYAIYIMLGFSLLIGIVYLLNKRHQREKLKLEKKRIDEVNEKEQRIDDITKKSIEEIGQLKNEKLTSEINHINTELATSTMHLLTKNEFINTIKTTLGNVILKSKNEEVKNQIKKIIKNIETNIKTDDDWDNFLIHFDKVHGDFSNRIKTQFPNLSPQEIKLSTYLRLNLSTKEIADLLNISVRGVEIGRYRLRKKLTLDRTQNLVEFILKY